MLIAKKAHTPFFCIYNLLTGISAPADGIGWAATLFLFTNTLTCLSFFSSTAVILQLPPKHSSFAISNGFGKVLLLL